MVEAIEETVHNFGVVELVALSDLVKHYSTAIFFVLALFRTALCFFGLDFFLLGFLYFLCFIYALDFIDLGEQRRLSGQVSIDQQIGANLARSKSLEMLVYESYQHLVCLCFNKAPPKLANKALGSLN